LLEVTLRHSLFVVKVTWLHVQRSALHSVLHLEVLWDIIGFIFNFVHLKRIFIAYLKKEKKTQESHK